MLPFTRTGIHSRASRSGFTLVELVLTIVLLLLLLSAVVFNFGSLQSKSDLEEGARQVEALIHFARAQSLAFGKKVELRIADSQDSSTLAPTPLPNPATAPNPTTQEPFTLAIEEDPIRAPGVFHPLAGAESFIQAIEERVRIRELKRLDQDLYPPNLSAPTPIPTSEESGTFDARIIPGARIALPQDNVKTTLLQPNEPPQEPQHFIHFYPDGSSDDAELLLRSISSEDHRRIRIRLRGLSGTLSREWETPPENELPPEDIATEPIESSSGGNR